MLKFIESRLHEVAIGFILLLMGLAVIAVGVMIGGLVLIMHHLFSLAFGPLGTQVMVGSLLFMWWIGYMVSNDD